MLDAIHLVRHGEVENPDHVVYADLPGFELSDTGWEQARAAGEFLADRPITAVFASPLTRAVQTAEVIAAHHDLATTIIDELTEFGLSIRWRGFRWEELDRRFPGETNAYLNHPWDLPFSPESLEQMMNRMERVMRSLNNGGSGGQIVAVSHQDPVQAARFKMTGRPIASFASDKPGHAEIITLQPGNRWREAFRWAPPIASGPFPPPPPASRTV